MSKFQIIHLTYIKKHEPAIKIKHRDLQQNIY